MVIRISGDGTITGISQLEVAGAINNSTSVNVQSANMLDLGSINSNSIVITGTTAITGLGSTLLGIKRTVLFASVLTLTHNASALILPSGNNITTQSGDIAEFESVGNGNWRCNYYTRANALEASNVDEAVAMSLIM